MDTRILNALVNLLEYNYEDEETDWEESGKPENHIFTQIKILSDFVSDLSEWNLEQVDRMF